MPPMPFPVSRNASIMAIERLFNQPDARPVVGKVLSDDTGEHTLARSLMQSAAEGSMARRAIEQAMADIGTATRAEAQYHELPASDADEDDIERGRHHLDEHWFKPQRPDDKHTHFWWNYIGEPEPIVRRGLRRALEVAGETLPIHLIWVCASPTFEVSISTVRNEAEGVDLAVSVLLSTPGTLFELAHLSDLKKRPDPLDVPFDDDQILVGKRGTREGDVVHQTGLDFEFPRPALRLVD